MKNNFIRVFSLALCLCLFVQTAVLCVSAQTEDTVYISSAEDLEALAEDCSLDTWSYGITVILLNDVSLEGRDFLPIPYFCGTFDGNGHTVSGLNVDDNISPAGLFSVVGEGGTVKDLTVIGNVCPEGDDECVGGIAGENRGLIMGCSFVGSVNGSSCVGGIVGKNTLTGSIRGCTADADVKGLSMTGGIAGSNAGSILECSVSGRVNTESTDPKLNLEDISIDNIFDIVGIFSGSYLNIATDTGGIAGYCSGSIVSCSNAATVGYKHIGYNVGGIAGRSCGYITGCSNGGAVYGRKDVGGIVGQMEPYISSAVSADAVDGLLSELEILAGIISDTLVSLNGTVGTLSLKMASLSEDVSDAVSNAKALADAVTEYADDTLTEINRGSELISEAFTGAGAVFGSISKVAETVEQAVDILETSVKDMTSVSDISPFVCSEIYSAISDIKSSVYSMKVAVLMIGNGLKDINSAFISQDPLMGYFDSLKNWCDVISSCEDNIAASVRRILSAVKDTVLYSGDVKTAVEELIIFLGNSSAGLKTVSKGISTLGGLSEFTFADACDGIKTVALGLTAVTAAKSAMNDTFTHLSNAVSGLAVASGSSLYNGVSGIANALKVFARIGDPLSDAVTELTSVFKRLGDADAVKFARPGDYLDSSSDSLYVSVIKIGDGITSLGKYMNGASRELGENIDRINAQYEKVTAAAEVAYEEAQESADDGIVTDTSAEDSDTLTEGKVFYCENTGEVYGDFGIGGIAGNVGIEFRYDPEEDIADDMTSSIRLSYQLKAVIRKCVNRGDVTAKRDWVGGIAGKMNFGLVSYCESYGDVTSETGSYVGGVCGLCSGTVDTSYAKCALGGEKYIGGIVGACSENASETSDGRVSNSVSLVVIDTYIQYAGAIAGCDIGEFENNRFVSDTLRGLDRISSTGRAERVEYEDLVSDMTVPFEFNDFTLSFVVDGEAVKTVRFNYRDSFGEEIYPDIPYKAGYSSSWDVDDLSDLRFDVTASAVYTPNSSSLNSSEKRGDRTLFFIEGSFEEGTSVSAQSVTADAADFSPLSLGIGDALAEYFSSFSEGGLPGRTVNLDLAEQWAVTIPDDGAAIHTVRYLSPRDDAESVDIYLRKGDGWVKAETDVVGSYLLFDVTELSFEMAAVVTSDITWAWIAALILLIAVVAAVSFAVYRAAKRGNRKAPSPKNENKKELKASGSKPAVSKPEPKKINKTEDEKKENDAFYAICRRRRRRRRIRIVVTVAVIVVIAAVAAVIAYMYF